jgi:excisionase family DNA binding protein
MRGYCGVLRRGLQMNKQDVATELNCSTRQVEKYASEDRLGTIEYVRGKRGREAKYDDEAVARLKAELTVKSQEIIGSAPQSHALQRAGNEQSMTMFVAALSDALREAQTQGNGVVDVPLRDKMTLSFKEASRLSGVPESHLRSAYAEGKLRGAKIGRGVRVSPDALKVFIGRLLK